MKYLYKVRTYYQSRGYVEARRVYFIDDTYVYVDYHMIYRKKALAQVYGYKIIGDKEDSRMRKLCILNEILKEGRYIISRYKGGEKAKAILIYGKFLNKMIAKFMFGFEV